MKKNSNLKVIIFYVVLIGIIIYITTSLLGGGAEEDKLKYSDIITYFKEEQVKSFEIDEENYLTLTLRDETNSNSSKLVTYRLLSLEIFYNDLNDTIQEQYSKGIIEEYTYAEPAAELPWWVSFLPYVVVIVLFVVLWIFFMNQATGKGGKIASFGRAKTKLGTDEKNKVRFSDVAGADEEKEELEEVVDFLKDPSHFTKLGAKIPHGVLLVGPPGTGKTLLAKAVAGEAGVPFYSISGSDFVEMYVGVGASRVRDLFETAKKNPASIIFIDEIDAVGRHRGAGLGGGHDEREQTLNQLLVEMDGFGSNDGVIVIAATNRPDILDPALLRPGRFDRQITVSYPDIKGREAILKVHAKNKPFEADVDLFALAKETAGFTGADLANVLNEAALLAARKGKVLIGMNDLEEATIKVIVGPQKTSMKIKEEEKRKTAYHEAGHAIVGHLLPTQDSVRRISIIPSGRALGYTLNPPEEDKYSEYKNELFENITMLLAGRVAEKITFDDISGGASNDIQRATAIARKMVTRLGMSDILGPVVYGGEHTSDEIFLGRDFNADRDYSEETASKIDNEIKRIIDEAYNRAEAILRENSDKLKFIAEFLVKYEVMDEIQFAAAMEKDGVTHEELDAMMDERRRRSEEENKAHRKAMEEKKRLEAEALQKETERLRHEYDEKIAESADNSPFPLHVDRDDNDNTDDDEEEENDGDDNSDNGGKDE